MGREREAGLPTTIPPPLVLGVLVVLGLVLQRFLPLAIVISLQRLCFFGSIRISQTLNRE